MVDEPENLVLVQLREIRAKVDAVSTKLNQHDRRFDALDKRFDEMRGYVVHALGLGSMNDMKGRELEVRMQAGEAYAKRVDERFADIEKRLTRIEEKVD